MLYRRLLVCVAGIMITSAICAAERDTVPVPGLADMAEPAFKDVNLFDSRTEATVGRRQIGELK